MTLFRVGDFRVLRFFFFVKDGGKKENKFSTFYSSLVFENPSPPARSGSDVSFYRHFSCGVQRKSFWGNTYLDARFLIMHIKTNGKYEENWEMPDFRLKIYICGVNRGEDSSKGVFEENSPPFFSFSAAAIRRIFARFRGSGFLALGRDLSLEQASWGSC